MSKVTSFCQTLLAAATEKYGPQPEEEGESQSQHPSLLNVGDILSLIVDIVEQDATVDVFETLDKADDRDDDDECEMSTPNSVTNSEAESVQSVSQNLSQEWESMQIGHEMFTLEFMQSVLKFYDSCKTKKFSQTTRRFPSVAYKMQIQRFREYVSNHGTKIQKLKVLEKQVLDKFVEARRSFYCVSGNDLQRWGKLKALDLKLDFTASSGWLHIFKRRHGIVSRKITKLTTQRETNEQLDLEKRASEFVENVKALSCNVPCKQIWNFDQSGFNYEHVNQRTLSEKGEKSTTAHVVSKNAATHSYSIMPLIAMNGQVAPKLLICLQETKGRFGPVVKSKLKVPNNIELTCSKSGKLDKHIMKNWLQSCVAKLGNKDEKIDLIFDSWTGQTDAELYNKMENVRKIHVIPPKTTPLIQPLDKFFFRQYKIIRTKIFERRFLGGFDVALHDRENVIKLHSLIYNQFQSPAFKPMIQYAWFACGYTDCRPGYFLNVLELLFQNSFTDCSIDGCPFDFFIKCSHCESALCIDHFYIKNHFHEM